MALAAEMVGRPAGLVTVAMAGPGLPVPVAVGAALAVSVGCLLATAVTVVQVVPQPRIPVPVVRVVWAVTRACSGGALPVAAVSEAQVGLARWGGRAGRAVQRVESRRWVLAVPAVPVVREELEVPAAAVVTAGLFSVTVVPVERAVMPLQ